MTGRFEPLVLAVVECHFFKTATQLQSTNARAQNGWSKYTHTSLFVDPNNQVQIFRRLRSQRRLGEFERQVESAIAQTDTGAGGGTRTHTTLPSRDFKSLASTSSATSAPLFLKGFSPQGNECFPSPRFRFQNLF